MTWLDIDKWDEKSGQKADSKVRKWLFCVLSNQHGHCESVPQSYLAADAPIWSPGIVGDLVACECCGKGLCYYQWGVEIGGVVWCACIWQYI